MENISKEEQLINLQEQDKYKDQLLANVSHDLRTPLNAIGYLIDRARDSTARLAQVSDLDMAQTNCDLLMSLINDILDYCQLKDQKLRLAITTFTLKDLLATIYKLMKIQTQLKGLDLIVQCNQDNIIMNTDLRRVKQILINLLSNAIKFTEQGSIRIRVTVSEKHNQVRFSVIDTGSGIEEEKLKTLGQPYQTFSTATNQNQSGIGLGLNLCKQLLSLLGPNTFFSIETTLNVGSKFSFIIYQNLENKTQLEMIPNNQLQSSASINSDNFRSEDIISEGNLLETEMANRPLSYFIEFKHPEIDLSSNVFKQNFTIMIVDDNVFNLFVLKSQLLKMNENFNIMQAHNGKLALEKFCRLNENQTDANIKLIIMDSEMPVMDGSEATRAIVRKITNDNFEVCPIIGYTAMLGTSEEKKCLDAGMCDVLQKPLQYNELKNKISYHLNQLL